MKAFGLRLLVAGSVLLAITSCDKEEETQAIDTAPVALEATYDDTFEEVDGIVESAMIYFNENGRVAEEEVDERIRCGIKTHDFENNTIIIDFGEGCVGWGGRIRKGKVIITYTDRKFIPGSVWVTTFEDFYVNDIKVEGVRTCTNVSASLDDHPSFNIMLENGKLTWPDGTFAEREANHTRTWIRMGNPLRDEVTVIGSASGKNRREVNYTMTIVSMMKYKRACWATRIFIPVEGVKLFKRDGQPDMLIDYGDGTCDSLVTVTVDGISREVDLRNWGF
ncbi:MAG: hypothetical protein KFF73_05865 [Cyclobacteriaceae bacterium]|nr:hypothetical protein [Cyclobacteriaceae bacterium]